MTLYIYYFEAVCIQDKEEAVSAKAVATDHPMPVKG